MTTITEPKPKDNNDSSTQETSSSLVDRLFCELYEYNIKYSYGAPEYLYQKHADYFMKHEVYAVPIPPYVIELEHLSNGLRRELAEFKTAYGTLEFANVLNKAVGRIFEEVNAMLYISSARHVLQVEITGSSANLDNRLLIGNYDKETVEQQAIIELVQSVDDPIEYILNVIGKEVKSDDKLARQVLYTILSSSTKNPMNLAINAPSGEGKSYVVNKVAGFFSDNDVISLAGMTDKALFHKRGTLAIKGKSGEYLKLKDCLFPIEKRLGEIKRELKNATESEKEDLDNEARRLNEDAEGLKNKAVKVIDLQNKTLVFLDTPKKELFDALMPLMSHDRYETTYEFVDKSEGIKTHTNVLIGYPSFIFTQAVDFSGYERADEIQRRFIVSNPKMDVGKYNEAADLISKKFSVPDFCYQEQVVSDAEKRKARSIANYILEQIRELNRNTEPGKNNVIIPFYQTVRDSLNVVKGLDMTSTMRLFSQLALLPIIKSYQKPKLVIGSAREEGEETQEPHLVIPLATFDDLRETLYLMENSSGVRPFIADWFDKVFMAAFNEKSVPDSITKEGTTIKGALKGLTNRQLADKHKEVYGKSITSKKLLETYIYPLSNNGFIDSVKGEIDRRANIYFPLINTEKYIKLFETTSSNNLLHDSKLGVINIATYPSKEYVESSIRVIIDILRKEGRNFLLKNHLGEEVSLEQLVADYYSNPEGYFTRGDIIEREHLSEEHLQNAENQLELHEISENNKDISICEDEQSKELFEMGSSNNLTYFDGKGNSKTEQEVRGDILPNKEGELTEELRSYYHEEFQKIISTPQPETIEIERSLEDLITAYCEIMKKGLPRDPRNNSVVYDSVIYRRDKSKEG